MLGARKQTMGMMRLGAKPWKRDYQTGAGAAVWGDNPAAEAVVHEEVAADVLVARAEHSNAWRLVSAYRRHGHKFAAINPVAASLPVLGPELDVARYGLSLESRVPTGGLVAGASQEVTVAGLAERLGGLYCGVMALEADYLEDEAEQEWLYTRYEELRAEQLGAEERKKLAADMLRCQAFDNFLATKFQSVKRWEPTIWSFRLNHLRYGGEGAEAMMGFFTELLHSAGQQGLNQVLCRNFLQNNVFFPRWCWVRLTEAVSIFSQDSWASRPWLCSVRCEDCQSSHLSSTALGMCSPT